MGLNAKVTLVIPTIRENCFLDFVKRWDDVGLFDHIDRFIVMEDNPSRTFQVPKTLKMCVDHFSWEDIQEKLGDDQWIIPRRSDTVRSFGYLEAFLGRRREREDRDPIHCDYVLTLDDDCYPPSAAQDGLEYTGLGFLKGHIDAMNRNRWFNTLNNVKPRGIPFYNTGTTFDRIIVNHGLWTNVLDYDAPYQLANPIKEDFSFDSRIVPAGLYFPMCGMNVMWRREATVLMYHLLMGKRKVMMDFGQMDRDGLVKLPFDRFGDIWCGIFMKKIADHSALHVTTGMPYIRHERASNPFTNLRKEANGIEVNEDLWEFVDRWIPRGKNLPELYADLGKMVKEFPQHNVHGRSMEKYKEHEEYFDLLGKAMIQWAGHFGEEE